MNLPQSHTKHCAILGVTPGDNWATIRSAYQHLIKRWHPDRFQDPEDRLFAEERTKEINNAYRALSDYHRQFGSLPVDPSPVVSAPRPRAQADDPAAPRYSDTGYSCTDEAGSPTMDTDLVSSNRHRLGGLAAAIALAVGYMVWGLGLFTGADHEEAELLGLETDSAWSDSTKGTDTRLLGYDKKSALPASTAGNINDLSLPARPDSSRTANPSPTSTPGTMPPTAFGKGSTKVEVLALQGPPLRETEHVWYYQASRVYFRSGKVVGWYESPDNPLKVVR